MPGTIEYGDLIRALGTGRATFVAHVGAGATATDIPLADLALGTADLTGNLVLLDARALGPFSEPTLAAISSNTATALTVPALSTGPAEGSTLWIFAVATIEAQMSENIKEIAGETVPHNPIGTPGAAVPAGATQVAGTDGTNLRALATDTQGRLSPQPVPGVWDAAGLAVVANVNVFATSYQPTSYGKLSITIGIDVAATAPHAVLVKTANTAPSGGSAGTRLLQLNGGQTLPAETIWEWEFDVTPNDSYNLQFDQACTVDVTATFKPN